MMKLLFAAGIPLGALILNWLFTAKFTFNLWDNFESFTPVTLYTHDLWLQGKVPILNFYQNLGTLVVGNGHSGALYFPYTIALGLLRLLNVDGQHLPEVMGLFHTVLASVGWWRLAQKLSIDEDLSLALAVGLATCGYFILGSAVWQHIGAEYAWFPWVLYFSIRPGAGFAFCWFMTAMGSHVQQLVYIALNTALFHFAYSWSHGQLRRQWPRVAVAAAWMPALSWPSVAYLLIGLSDSQRSSGISDEIFFENSVHPLQLLGLLTPSATGDFSVFGSNSAQIVFVGIWLPLGLVAVARERTRLGGAIALIGLLFLDFALGKNGLIYPLTKDVPIWSSLRWPMKFTLHFVTMLAVAAAIGMSLLKRAGVTPRLRESSLLLVGLALVIGFPQNAAGALMLASQGLWLVAWAGQWRWRTWILRSALGVYAAVAIGHQLSQPAHRYNEKYGEFGSAYFGIERPREERLAVLSAEVCAQENCVMQSQSLFDSATANGYLALAGTIVGTAPIDFSQLIAGQVWGFVNSNLLGRSVASPLFRSLGVRYYLLRDKNLAQLEPLLRERGLAPQTRKDGWTLYRDPLAKSIVSTPDQVVRVQPGPPTLLVFGGENRHVAYAEGLPGNISPSPVTVSGLNWNWGRGLELDAENSSQADSFLQLSLYPHRFLRATLNGAAVNLYKTSHVASGVVIPPGRHRLAVAADLGPLVYSLLTAAGALLIGLLILNWHERRHEEGAATTPAPTPAPNAKGKRPKRRR